MLKHKLLGLVACSAFAMTVAACDDGNDGTTGVASATGTGTASDSDSDSDSSSSSDSNSDSDSDSDSDPSTTTDDPSTSTTSDTADCSPDDPCQTDADCDTAAGESCIDCICFGGNSSDSDSDTDTGGAGDPSFPNPANGCPQGYVDGNMALNPGINICLPACDGTAADAVMACPQPATGMAIGVCNLTQPGGEPTACTMQEALMACGDMDGFYCLGDGMGGYNCDERVLCTLACDPAQAPCPDGLTCNASGLCEY